MDISNYVPPGVAMVLPHLDEVCNILLQDPFKRAITDYTKELCKNDPELADIILEGEKTLPCAILYVLQKAQEQALTKMEAMSEDELNQLGTTTVQGIQGRMVGTSVESDQAYQWAKDYYYGGKDVEPKDATTISSATRNTAKQPAAKGTDGNGKNTAGKNNKKNSTGTGSKNSGTSKSTAASPCTATEPDTIDEGTQIGFADLAAAASSGGEVQKPAA